MDGLAMEYVRAYFFLRSTTPSSGFGHNPISVEQYIGFAKLLLSGMITDVSCGVVMPGMVTIFHAADMKFLELENAKQEAKSSKSSGSKAPRIT